MNARTPHERAMILAALCGSKIALGPALLATSRNRPNRGAWVAALMGEMLLDKVGVFPARWRPSLLVPHTLAGAWTARESLREDGIDDPWAAATGGLVAAAVSCALPAARIALNRLVGVPDMLLGAAEDYLALRTGAEAVDVPLDRMPEIARDAIEDVGERVRPALRSVGVGG